MEAIAMNGLTRAQMVNTLAMLVAQAAVARGAVDEVEAAKETAERLVRVRTPRYEPHQGTREMERRRKQRARAGLPVAEPAPIDLAACVGIDEEGA
jgi:hypothetical protein